MGAGIIEIMDKENLFLREAIVAIYHDGPFALTLSSVVLDKSNERKKERISTYLVQAPKMKELLRAMQEMVLKYETEYGPIPEEGGNHSPIQIEDL